MDIKKQHNVSQITYNQALDYCRRHRLRIGQETSLANELGDRARAVILNLKFHNRCPSDIEGKITLIDSIEKYQQYIYNT